MLSAAYAYHLLMSCSAALACLSARTAPTIDAQNSDDLSYTLRVKRRLSTWHSFTEQMRTIAVSKCDAVCYLLRLRTSLGGTAKARLRPRHKTRNSVRNGKKRRRQDMHAPSTPRLQQLQLLHHIPTTPYATATCVGAKTLMHLPSFKMQQTFHLLYIAFRSSKIR